MKLSATKVKNAKAAEKPYKLTDGDGMHLLVRPLKDKYKGASKLLSLIHISEPTRPY